MSSDRLTLEALMFAWGDAYIVAYARDRWVAIRRDGLLFLPAATLTPARPPPTPTTRPCPSAKTP
jgi:hypothetical protein